MTLRKYTFTKPPDKIGTSSQTDTDESIKLMCENLRIAARQNNVIDAILTFQSDIPETGLDDKKIIDRLTLDEIETQYFYERLNLKVAG